MPSSSLRRNGRQLLYTDAGSHLCGRDQRWVPERLNEYIPYGYFQSLLAENMKLSLSRMHLLGCSPEEVNTHAINASPDRHR
jgi:hypothetical protein